MNMNKAWTEFAKNWISVEHELLKTIDQSI